MAYFCESSAMGLTVLPCGGDAGTICSWKPSKMYYDCVAIADGGADAMPQADPSGMYPLTCP
jgi:hypothetical protein